LDLGLIYDLLDRVNPKVLIADHSPSSVKLLKYTCESHGFVVMTVGNGEALLQTLKDNAAGHYDLVLVDMNMPGMTGVEAIRDFRKWEMEEAKASMDGGGPRPRQLNVAIMSSRFNNLVYEPGIFDFVLEKPLDTAALYEVIERVKQSHKVIV
jgi:CheY-like chemotaxis protein